MLDEHVSPQAFEAGAADDDIQAELAFLLQALDGANVTLERADLADGELVGEAMADLTPRERFAPIGPVLTKVAAAGLATFPAVLAPVPAFAGEPLPANVMLAMAERPNARPAGMGATAIQLFPFTRPMQQVRAQVSAPPEVLPGPTQVKLPLNPRVKAIFAASRQVVVTTKREQAATFVRVQKGDSLYAIAKRTLGSGARWREIYEANQGKIASTYLLKPGMQLTVPTLRNVAPVATAAATTAHASVAAAIEKPLGATEGAHGPNSYRVAPGDSLYVIAQKKLGNSNRWREILALNKAMLNGKTVIYPNQWLMLPTLT